MLVRDQKHFSVAHNDVIESYQKSLGWKVGIASTTIFMSHLSSFLVFLTILISNLLEQFRTEEKFDLKMTFSNVYFQD